MWGNNKKEKQKRTASNSPKSRSRSSSPKGDSKKRKTDSKESKGRTPSPSSSGASTSKGHTRTPSSSGASSSLPANKNTLQCIKVISAIDTLKDWGKYEQKVRWKLDSKAKERGYILQVVKFEWKIQWVKNNKYLTQNEVSNAMRRDMNRWAYYSELWLISANKKEPSRTLNQDHFIFPGIEDTYGYMIETGEAYFFESTKSAEYLKFSKNPDCPAGEYMPSKRGKFVPSRDVIKTRTITHKVRVEWDQNGKTQVVEEVP